MVVVVVGVCAKLVINRTSVQGGKQKRGLDAQARASPDMPLPANCIQCCEPRDLMGVRGLGWDCSAAEVEVLFQHRRA